MNACHSIGEAYETGKGVRADRGRALSFYGQACWGGRKPDCSAAVRLKSK
jgi:TPR repeat protein